MTYNKLFTTSKNQWRKLKPEARRMRHGATAAEGLLWQSLRGGKLGAKFRRQHAIGRFVVDFYCVEKSLIIEVDGPYHERIRQRDQEREAHLSALGIKVLRYCNKCVESSLDAIVEEIRGALKGEEEHEASTGARGELVV